MELGERRAIVYGVNAQHATSVASYAEKKGRNPGLLLGKAKGMSADDCQKSGEETLSRFEDGSVDTLINVEVASEGGDVPACDTALMLRPTKSLAFYLQTAGRALRPSPGKRTGLMLAAAVVNNRRFGLPDADMAWSLEPRGASSENADEMPSKSCFNCSALNPISERVCRCFGTPFGKTCSACGAFRVWEEFKERPNGYSDRCEARGETRRLSAFAGEARSTNPAFARMSEDAAKPLQSLFRKDSSTQTALTYIDPAGIRYRYSPLRSLGGCSWRNYAKAWKFRAGYSETARCLSACRRRIRTGCA